MILNLFRKKLFSKKYDEYMNLLKLNKNYTQKDLKNAYIKFSKIYHPDIYKDDTKFKLIKEAFEELKNKQFKAQNINNSKNDSKSMNEYNMKKENIFKNLKYENELNKIDEIIQNQYNLNFGKKYEDDPLYYFSDINNEKRLKFIEFINNLEQEYKMETKFKLLKQNKINNNNENSYNNFDKNKFDKENNNFIIFMFFFIFINFLYFFKFKNYNKKIEIDDEKPDINLKKDINNEKISELKKEDTELNKKDYLEKLSNNLYKKTILKKEKQIKKIKENFPNMLKIDKDFNNLKLNDIIVQYTIHPDINLYTINPSIIKNNFLKKIKNQEFGQFFEIDNKFNYNINTYATLSLEAERISKHIFISTNFLKQQLEETGNFKTPIIVFKFRGWNFFKWRKNLIFNNVDLNNKKYISLFDLYFAYHSPWNYKFPMIRDFFINEHIDHHNLEKWNGMVHFNTKKIQPKLIEKMEDVIIINYENMDYKVNSLADKLFYRSYYHKVYNYN